MSNTIFCISCDFCVDKDECTIVCNECFNFSFSEKSQWFSVRDQLPKENKIYVVIFLDKNNACNDELLGFSSFCTESNKFSHNNVGCWFELPDMPTGKSGMILFNAWCIPCDAYHQQWKLPCVCENGKVAAEPLGYKLCDKCNGRGYLNESMDKP